MPLSRWIDVACVVTVCTSCGVRVGSEPGGVHAFLPLGAQVLDLDPLKTILCFVWPQRAREGLAQPRLERRRRER